MTSKDPKKKSGNDVPKERGEQAEILASSSDEEQPNKELARDRQPKPEDAEKLKRAMEEEPKPSRKTPKTRKKGKKRSG